MRVALVTPMTVDAVSPVVLALPALAERWDVEVWCPAEPEPVDLPAGLGERHVFAAPDATVVSALRAYDLVVYALADTPHHRAVLSLAREVPGLVVLQDVVLLDLVVGTALAHGWFEELVGLVEETYGPQPASLLRDPTPGAHRALGAVAPLVEFATTGSLGVVVGSTAEAAAVDGHTLGQVTVASTETADVHAYAQALVHAGDLARAARPPLHLAGDLARLLSRLGLQEHPTVVDRAVTLASELFELT